MRIILASGCIMGMSFAFLWHFNNIRLYGTHLIQKPNSVILYSEISLISAIFIFGVYLFVINLKKVKEKKSDF